jgi:aminoglycoside/choline kinase family phosphotransferase
MEISPQELKTHCVTLLELHEKHFSEGVVKYEPLLAHGSDRIIIRLIAVSGISSIGIVNRHPEENLAFISFARHFKSFGLSVPDIYIVSHDSGSYLLEDLGDETLLQRITSEGGISESVKKLYRNILDQLILFQVKAGKDIDYSLCYQYGNFGEKNIDFDLNYFRERFLSVFYKDITNVQLLNIDLDLLKKRILEMPGDHFMYRDFQSRNIMLRSNVPYFIDFQSGRKGPLLYDAASLLYDAKADIPQTIREELLDHYLQSVNEVQEIDIENYRRHFWYFALIRILQAMGAYGYLGIVKGKRRFLESIPYAIKNINFILETRIPKDELNSLKTIFAKLLNADITDK